MSEYDIVLTRSYLSQNYILIWWINLGKGNVARVTRKVWEGCLYASTCLLQACKLRVGRMGERRGSENGRATRSEGRGTRSQQDTCTQADIDPGLFSKVTPVPPPSPPALVSTTSRPLAKYVTRSTNPELDASKGRKRERERKRAKSCQFLDRWQRRKVFNPATHFLSVPRTVAANHRGTLLIRLCVCFIIYLNY